MRAEGKNGQDEKERRRRTRRKRRRMVHVVRENTAALRIYVCVRMCMRALDVFGARKKDEHGRERGMSDEGREERQERRERERHGKATAIPDFHFN